MKRLILSLIIFGCTEFAWSDRAYSIEPLHYEASVSSQETIKISSFLSSTNADNYEITHIAKNDLNDDGIDETIVITNTCETSTEICQIYVLANLDISPALLGRINAKNIAISNQSSYGVRDLLVYNNAKNDYDYEIMRWNPKQSTYQLVKGGAQ